MVDAPVASVWAVVEDLTLIPRYHPDVRDVELVSGDSTRAPGVTYKCVIPEGPRKGWCVERVVENVPFRRMSIDVPEDSWGLGRMMDGFLAELTLEPVGDEATVVRLRAFYGPRDLKARLLNVILLRRTMRKRAGLTLEGLKRLVEGRVG